MDITNLVWSLLIQLDVPPKMKMECLATYTLFGNIMSMQSVSLSGSTRDALLLSFKYAKMSVVEYDLDTHDLKTLSLHYFEEEEIRKQTGTTKRGSRFLLRYDKTANINTWLMKPAKGVVETTNFLISENL